MPKKPNGAGSNKSAPTSLLPGQVDGQEIQRHLQAELLRAAERSRASSHYIPDAGEDGKSERVQVRLPPSMIKAMGVLMQSGKLPYLTVSDLIRSAIYLHLVYCFEEAKLPVTPMTALKLMVEAAQEMKSKKDLERAVLNLRQAAQQLIDSGDTDEAKKQLGALWSKIASFPDSNWKRRLESQIKTMYTGVGLPGNNSASSGKTGSISQWAGTEEW